MIAALYVQRGGCYWDLEGVDPWDEARDARLYAGPWPVVAHPPCERWGNFFWAGGGRRGDDGGCFEAALASVRKWGGVLEHPAGSGAWRAFQLCNPGAEGAWVAAGDFEGWTCCVEQGHYGHRAPKRTWLYAVGCRLPSLRWGPSGATGRVEMMSGKGTERAATPIPFRDLLLDMARTVRVAPGRAA